MGRTAPEPVYRALFCDLRTDRLMDVLPLTETKFDDFIGKPGSLTATVPLPQGALAARARAALQPGRTAVWLERDGDIWWGGVLWTCTPVSDEQGRLTVQFQAGTFDSYLDHRILSQDLTVTGLDQFDIARTLVAHAQEQPGGDIGISLGHERSGIVRDYSHAYSALARIRELLDKLGQLNDGFEWRIHCYRDAGGCGSSASSSATRRSAPATTTSCWTTPVPSSPTACPPTRPCRRTSGWPAANRPTPTSPRNPNR